MHVNFGCSFEHPFFESIHTRWIPCESQQSLALDVEAVSEKSVEIAAAVAGVVVVVVVIVVVVLIALLIVVWVVAGEFGSNWSWC